MYSPEPCPSSLEPDTQLTHLGRSPSMHAGLVNVPVYRGSTILASTFEEWEAQKQAGNLVANYGRFGSPLSRALEESICELEGGHGSMLFPSGLSACTHALLGLLRSGDHLLITDNVYRPTRTFAEQVLKRLQIEVEYFDPADVAGFRDRVTDRTRVVYLESPGSLTFELQDVPALARAAHSVGAFVLLDNTWATPLYFKPFAHGVDVSVHAATKYIVGHSDALLGVATANERAWPALQSSAHHFGEIAGPDDIFLALRGMRTLSVRLKRHWENGVQLARAMASHPGVAAILHPALPCHPGHDLWRRDFLGASGLFGVVLKPMTQAQLSRLFGSFKLFGIGLSWGGYESLALRVDPRPGWSAAGDINSGPLLRIHAGLEGAHDLVADMTKALDAAVEEGER